jgi:hypothetical protein
MLSSCGSDAGDSEVAELSTTTTTPATTELATTLPSPSGRPPTKHDIAGTWATVGEALQWRFTPKGDFAYDRFNLDAPATRGTWTLTGTTIRLVALGAGCVDEWDWRAGIENGKSRAQDKLEVVFLREGCDRIAGTRLTLVRIA